MTEPRGPRRPELLAPAGDQAALKAALLAGADAVYLAGRRFGARAFAPNFDENGLRWARRVTRSLNRRLYITVNTLVFDGEWHLLDEALEFYEALRPDALIIQDLGVAAHIVRRGSRLPRHLSTQAAWFGTGGVEVLQDLGISRVILPRELTLEEIRDLATRVPFELEVFVHGAMCYSISGRCFWSIALGSRSGNRGTCAQPCRKPYRGAASGAADAWFFSPRDLRLVDRLADLRLPRVAALKIEGRMKGPEYVFHVVQAYRQALDAVPQTGHLPGEPRREFRGHDTEHPNSVLCPQNSRNSVSCPQNSQNLPNPDSRNFTIDRPPDGTPRRPEAGPAAGGFEEVLGRGFTRTFHEGFLDRPPAGDWTTGDHPGREGVPLGTVVARRPGGLTELACRFPPQAGDGVAWEDAQGHRQGDRLTFVEAVAGRPGHYLVRGLPDGLPPRTPVQRTASGGSPDWMQGWRKEWERAPVDLFWSGREGQPLAVETMLHGRAVRFTSSEPLALAVGRGLEAGVLADKFATLGEHFRVRRQVVSALGPGLFIPLTGLKKLKRALVDALLHMERLPPPPPESPSRLPVGGRPPPLPGGGSPGSPEFRGHDTEFPNSVSCPRNSAATPGTDQAPPDPSATVSPPKGQAVREPLTGFGAWARGPRDSGTEDRLPTPPGHGPGGVSPSPRLFIRVWNRAFPFVRDVHPDVWILPFGEAGDIRMPFRPSPDRVRFWLPPIINRSQLDALVAALDPMPPQEFLCLGWEAFALAKALPQHRFRLDWCFNLVNRPAVGVVAGQGLAATAGREWPADSPPAPPGPVWTVAWNPVVSFSRFPLRLGAHDLITNPHRDRFFPLEVGNGVSALCLAEKPAFMAPPPGLDLQIDVAVAPRENPVSIASALEELLESVRPLPGRVAPRRPGRA
ncbi:MAG: U32 family peptidase [Candidatus Riflebacteria bacterium]|nr:U32 family peptidase [Candidatus Riflebacteria bacterium]